MWDFEFQNWDNPRKKIQDKFVTVVPQMQSEMRDSVQIVYPCASRST